MFKNKNEFQIVLIETLRNNYQKMTFWLRILFDLVTLAVLFTIQQILTSSLIRPFQQSGFYCNDYSVNFEYKQSTVTNLHLILISFVSPIIILMFMELIRTIISCRSKVKTEKYSNNFRLSLTKQKSIKVPDQLGNLYVNIGHFLFGLLATNLITNIGKLMIGRLRPNFLSVCKPNITSPYATLCASLIKTYLIPDIDFKCMQTNLKELQDARKSFPSGHSSLTFYSMVFLALFINHCWNCRLFGNLMSKLLQLVLVSIAFFTALSRVTDNKHHPTDVLTGAIIGVLCALVTYRHLLKHFKKRDYKMDYDLVGTNKLNDDLNEKNESKTNE